MLDERSYLVGVGVIVAGRLGIFRRELGSVQKPQPQIAEVMVFNAARAAIMSSRHELSLLHLFFSAQKSSYVETKDVNIQKTVQHSYSRSKSCSGLKMAVRSSFRPCAIPGGIGDMLSSGPFQRTFAEFIPCVKAVNKQALQDNVSWNELRIQICLQN